MSDYRFTQLTGEVNYLKPRSPIPQWTGRTHLSASDIDADFFARKLLRNTAPSLCSILDASDTRTNHQGFSSIHRNSCIAATSNNERLTVHDSERDFGVSSLSPTTTIVYPQMKQGQQRYPQRTALDVNERYKAPSNLNGLGNSLLPHMTTRSVDIRTCPGRPKVFQNSHVNSAIMNCTKCFNNGKRRTTQVFCPHVFDRCHTFGETFQNQLFGRYRDVAMEKQFN